MRAKDGRSRYVSRVSTERHAAMSPAHAGAQFTTTHWSVVLNARDRDAPAAREALERLCRSYWYPLYAYIRRRGHSEEDARDLVQGFFARLISTEALSSIEPSKGRFRSFLIASCNHFLANEWDRANRLKRGGGAEILSFDTAEGESRYSLEPVDELTAEKLYERRWALTLIESTLRTLENESLSAGRAEAFAVLRSFLSFDEEISYADAAARLQMTEGAVRVAVHRLRQRYRELLRLKVAETLSAPHEVDAELAHLLTVVSA
jgi:RNA polymerase sigma-70 factor (ECF subfamily)